jgi:hypothetical protein
MWWLLRHPQRLRSRFTSRRLACTSNVYHVCEVSLWAMLYKTSPPMILPTMVASTTNAGGVKSTCPVRVTPSKNTGSECVAGSDRGE